MNSFIKTLREYQIVFALLLILVGWFLIQIQDVLIALFIAYIIMAALYPLVQALVNNRVPKGLAVALTYILTLAVVILLILPLIPFFTTQITLLFVRFPEFITTAGIILGIQVNPDMFSQFATSEVGSIGRNALSVTSQIFGGVFLLLTTFVLSFYMLLDRTRIIKGATALFPPASQPRVEETIHFIEEKLGAWVRGQVVLSVFIGVITWIALTLIGLPYALPLAVLAGMLEIVPTIGPIIAAIPAVIVALNFSGTATALVIVAYIVIQILENNLLVPRIMQKAVGLNPIIVILGVVAGGKLLGIVGALLAVPFISLLIVVIKAVRKTA